MEQTAKKIVAWQISRGILSEKDRAVYQYAYELLISQTINILLAGIIAFLFKAPFAVVTFLACYIPLRSFCGGYHANTNLGCTIVSALVLCVVLFVYQETGRFLLKWYPLIFIAAGCMVMKFAPVQDHNKPLDETEREKYRTSGRIIWIIEAVIGVFMYLWHVRLGLVIALSHMLLSVMLGLGVFKNQKIE